MGLGNGGKLSILGGYSGGWGAAGSVVFWAIQGKSGFLTKLGLGWVVLYGWSASVTTDAVCPTGGRGGDAKLT